MEQRRGPEWGRKPPGECRLSQRDNQIIIERADPQVWLTDEFLQRLVGPESNNNWVNLTYHTYDVCQPQSCCQRFRGGHCYFGGVVTISATNGSVIYRIGRFLRGGFWEAQRESLTTTQQRVWPQFVDIEIIPNGHSRSFRILDAASGKLAYIHTVGPSTIVFRLPTGYTAEEITK